jgi:Protein of unknown function (DUF3768)
MERPEHTATIRTLNDNLRQTFIDGRVVMTEGVAALEKGTLRRLISEVKAFDDFKKGNDPHGEHDFGSLDLGGQKFFWKIDYYDLTMKAGSDDPANSEITTRVLTIMRADEY